MAAETRTGRRMPASITRLGGGALLTAFAVGGALVALAFRGRGAMHRLPAHVQASQVDMDAFTKRMNGAKVLLNNPVTGAWITRTCAAMGLTVRAQPSEDTRSAGAPAQAAWSISGAVDNARLDAALHKLSLITDRPFRNPRLALAADGEMHTAPGADGVALDVRDTSQRVAAAWQVYVNQASTTLGANSIGAVPSQTSPPAPITAQQAAPHIGVVMAMVKTRPTLQTSDLKLIDGLLGRYTTRYGGSSPNRKSNIALAARHINGTTLAPGQIFSYNNVVGPRIEQDGFKTAPVIIKGELVPGMGGGVCQVSSTLYNAVLLADLKVVRRAHHAFPVHYLPPGRDATVAWGSIDFRFANSMATPICIFASAWHNRLTFSIYGKKQAGRDVDIELADRSVQPVAVERVKDPALPPGRVVVKDKGHPSIHVTVYRVTRENGEVVSRQLISRDHYRMFPRILLVGSAPAPQPHPALPQTPPQQPLVPPVRPGQ
ncbi:MAG: VanW family protein [Armatimonadetes bacterium]|nr:VanW family protein [Armatimonadota bacterium]MDE2207198.1 VanW family protein [Armatimonadota bacterium]